MIPENKRRRNDSTLEDERTGVTFNCGVDLE
jgi:hypothetical protein